LQFDHFVKMLVRRWRLTMIGLVVVAIGVAGLLFGVPPNYKATGTLLLTPPPQTHDEAITNGNPGAQNSVLSFSDTLNVFANIVVKGLTNDPRLANLAAQTGASVSLAAPTASPSLAIFATASSTATAESAARQAMTIVQSYIREFQTQLKAPDAVLVNTTAIIVPNRASPVNNTRNKLLLVWLIFGVLGAGGFVALVDRRSTKRQAPKVQPLQPGTIATAEWDIPERFEPEPLVAAAAARGARPAPPRAPRGGVRVTANGANGAGRDESRRMADERIRVTRRPTAR